MQILGYHHPRRTFVWTTYEKVLAEFGRDRKQARAAYRQFVSAGIGQELATPVSRALRRVLVGGEASLETIRHVVAEEFGIDGADAIRVLVA